MGNIKKKNYREVVAFSILALFSSIAIYSGDYAWYYFFSDSPVLKTILLALVAAAVMYIICGILMNVISKKYENKTFKKYTFSFIAYSIMLYTYIFTVESILNGVGFSWFRSILGNPRGDVFSNLDLAVIASMVSYIVMFIYNDRILVDKVKTSTSNLLHIPKKIVSKEETKTTTETISGNPSEGNPLNGDPSDETPPSTSEEEKSSAS